MFSVSEIVSDSISVDVSGSEQWDEATKKATFTPTNPLKPGVGYRVVLNGTAFRTVDGGPWIHTFFPPYEWQFETTQPIDVYLCREDKNTRKRFRWCGEADFDKFVVQVRNRLELQRTDKIVSLKLAAGLADVESNADIADLREGDVVRVEVQRDEELSGDSGLLLEG